MRKGQNLFVRRIGSVLKALAFSLCVLVLSISGAKAVDWPSDLLNKVEELHTKANAKEDMPAQLDGIPVIDGAKAYELWKAGKAIFLDNRVKSQYEAEHIKGAKWFLTDELIKNPDKVNELDKNKEYVLYCNGVKCWRSPAAALLLKHAGFKVLWYREGIPDWKKRGYPVE